MRLWHGHPMVDGLAVLCFNEGAKLKKAACAVRENFPNGGDFGDALDNQRLRIS
jgi:hypothetical protein